MVKLIKELEHTPSEHPPHVTAVSDRCGEHSGLAQPQRVDKRWGYELIYINTEDYCMKQLVIRPGQSTSMHFHVHKHETLTVVQGKLLLSYNDGRSGKVTQVLVPKDHAWVIAPGFQHKLEAYGDENLVLIEASTQDNSIDSVRVTL